MKKCKLVHQEKQGWMQRTCWRIFELAFAFVSRVSRTECKANGMRIRNCLSDKYCALTLRKIKPILTKTWLRLLWEIWSYTFLKPGSHLRCNRNSNRVTTKCESIRGKQNTSLTSGWFSQVYSRFSRDVTAAMLYKNNSEKSLLGIWFYYYAKLERHFAIVLCTNMAVSSREGKPRIEFFKTAGDGHDKAMFLFCSFCLSY